MTDPLNHTISLAYDAKGNPTTLTGKEIGSGLYFGNCDPHHECCDHTTDADPVDLATGLMVEEQTDLTLADVIPLTLTRTMVKVSDLLKLRLMPTARSLRSMSPTPVASCGG